MTDQVQPATLDVPIIARQFRELDTLFGTMPDLRITNITINYQQGTVAFRIGIAPSETHILRVMMLKEMLDSLQELSDYEADCVCNDDETCPTCRAAFLIQVYCWAQKHIA